MKYDHTQLRRNLRLSDKRNVMKVWSNLSSGASRVFCRSSLLCEVRANVDAAFIVAQIRLLHDDEHALRTHH